MPEVSIIIPAYNAAEYLPQTLESICSQDYDNFEVIVVDDGSTDSTAACASRAAAADTRIRVFSIPNSGVCVARNHGLDEARGRWVAFVDADDILLPGALRILVDAAETTGARLVIADIVKFSGRIPRPRQRHKAPVTMTAAETIEAALYQRRGIDCSPCGKLFAADLWKDLRFRSGTRYEDLDIFYRVCCPAGRVARVHTPVYAYRQHPGSFMHSFRREHADSLDVTDRMVAWAAAGHEEFFPAARDRRMSAHFNFLLRMYASGQVWPDLERRCLDVIADSAPASLCNSRVRPKNRIGALVYALGGPRFLRMLAKLS